MATLYMAVRWFYAWCAFITHGGTKETCFSALIDSLIAGSPLWVPMISNVITSINILTTDCVIRCWIIWERNWSVVVLPSLCTLCGTIFDNIFLVKELTLLTNSQGNLVTPWGSDTIIWGVAYSIL
ncbi:hypothetical protein ARMSODRAFT_1020162 [Armillaria solidipes]|uniref:Uncharacterized protein n=1 Tax=Armillaria solidipes TaxID=1076256 RepID=A0A2H3BQ22_9AGAR|nr:hypothetical protein ARMSODRAFT_1020162 [Armillaria solidipes]